MMITSDTKPRVAEARAVWVAAGVLGIVLHRPWSPPILLVIGVPWVSGLLLLAGKGTASRLARVWREAVMSREGVFGAAGLMVVVFCAALVMGVGAGVLLGLWLGFGLSVIGIVLGPSTLRSQLAGWSLLSLAATLTLFGAEGFLSLRPVAARLGTPAEVERWHARYDRSWERNVLGIRSPYETVRKDSGVTRIVVIGDSFTWGDKIAVTDSTWPAQLEEQLRRQQPQAAIEVVNLAKNGFTTVNGAELLRRVGWQFDPDLVLVQFYMNDILPSEPEFVRHYSEWLFPRAWVLPQRYRRGRLGQSALLYVVEGALTAWRHGDRVAQAAKWTALYQQRGTEWNALAGALDEMGRAAAERHVPIVLVLFPDFIPGVRAEAAVPFRSIHDQVGQAASSAGFSILDLTAIYLREGNDLQHWWATPYDAHPNEAAARVAANGIAQHLQVHFFDGKD